MDWYKGNGVRHDDVDLAIPAERSSIVSLEEPSGYRPSLEARDAVNVAILMGMPLLISGEPGSGKTQLGYAVAHELGLGTPALFTTKSTSQARDLFYRYDALRHFHATQSGGSPDAGPYIELQALGVAINDALPVAQRLPFGNSETAGADHPRRSLVIVDEIDKAPRDFANDLLYEFDQLRFRVPEMGNIETPAIEPDHRPILFVTTNAEQLLPDAFLRRCAFLHLKPPRGSDLAALIERRFHGILTRDHPLVRDIVLLTDEMRDRGRLDRPASSAELLQFLAALLARGAEPHATLAEQPVAIETLVALLGKSASDLAWLQQRFTTA